LQDSLRALLAAAIVVAVVASVLELPSIRPVWLDRAGRVVAALTAELVAVALLRLAIPRARPGDPLIAGNWQYVRWLMSSVLVEVALHPWFRAPMWFFHITRFLYLRALGADLSWRVAIPADLGIRDPALLTIEAGTQIEAGVVIENAIHTSGRVRIDRVSIGGGCLIGEQAILMPGASLAHDARVSPGAYLGPDAKVGVAAKIGERAVLASGVEVGSYAVIEAGAVLSEGVRVADGARIGAGAVVPPNTEVQEREIWVGAPAGPLPRKPTESRAAAPES
jgi:carbonic anhydrase/acetyltransferase-like protein (isoleucine patch superfamily)